MWSGAYILGYIGFLMVFVVHHDKLAEIISNTTSNPFHLPMWFADLIAAVLATVWPVVVLHLLLKRLRWHKDG